MPATLVFVHLILAIAAFGAACVLAKRVGVVVPFALIAIYVMAVGAVTFINISVFHLADPKFGVMRVEAWLELYWPLWTVFFAPSAISALLACWFSRPWTRRDASVLLAAYLFLILVAIEIGWALDGGLFFLVGAFALLTVLFLVMAYWERRQPRHRPSDHQADRTLDV
jgi:hypothetical protein